MPRLTHEAEEHAPLINTFSIKGQPMNIEVSRQFEISVAIQNFKCVLPPKLFVYTILILWS